MICSGELYCLTCYLNTNKNLKVIQVLTNKHMPVGMAGWDKGFIILLV